MDIISALAMFAGGVSGLHKPAPDPITEWSNFRGGHYGDYCGHSEGCSSVPEPAVEPRFLVKVGDHYVKYKEPVQFRFDENGMRI